MSKIKNGGLDQSGAEPFEQQQFGTAGVEGVNVTSLFIYVAKASLLKLMESHLDSLCSSSHQNALIATCAPREL